MMPVSAISLGELRHSSALGERFEAVIQVLGDEDDDLDASCFSLVVEGQENNVRAIKRGHFVLRGRGTRRELVFHGSDIEREPVIQLRIRYACPQSSQFVEREYAVLLDPRATMPTSAPVSLPVVTPEPVHPPVLKPVRQVIASSVFRRAKRNTLIPSTPEKEHGLHLQIAIVPPDLSKVPPLDEKTALAMRERLLLIEADDQAAQLLQLKDRLSRLEKQLDHVSSLTRTASKPLKLVSPVPTLPVQEKLSRSQWVLTAVIGLSLLSLPFLWFWFRRRSQIREQKLLSEIFPPSEMALPDPERLPGQDVQPVQPQPNSVSWPTDEMDVVSPNNVNEEVQLLLDHGLAAQALTLLIDEIRLRPSALAMWMRLFETCVLLGDRVTFTLYAERFRSQFLSESLWDEVLAMGKKLGLDSFTGVSNEPVLLEGKDTPRGNDDFDISEYLLPTQPLVRPQSGPKREALDLPPLVFSLDLDPRGQESVAQKDEFQSDDPELAAISILLHRGDATEAYGRLEQLLYSGSMAQRITASRWLDLLLPVKGQGN